MHIAFLMVQGLFLVLSLIMDRYSHHRMGLSRHFFYDHYRFEAWSTAKPLMWAVGLLALLAVIVTIYHYVKHSKAWGFYGYCHGLMLIVYSLLLLFCISPWRQNIMTYPYLIFILPVFIGGNLLALYFYRPK